MLIEVTVEAVFHFFSELDGGIDVLSLVYDGFCALFEDGAGDSIAKHNIHMVYYFILLL